ncbi:MAG: pentapeptide repeat-containing protein, partial [Ktedonobacteraceae bacterium]
TVMVKVAPRPNMADIIANAGRAPKRQKFPQKGRRLPEKAARTNQRSSTLTAGPAFAGPNAAPTGSGLERGPHKLQIIHQLRGLQTVRVGLGGNLILLGIGDALIQDGQVQLGHRDGFLSQHSDLGGADLSEANLHEAFLDSANFSGANLHKANFSGTNLHKATFAQAKLSKANFIDAELRGADLSGADLSEAKFGGANLEDALSLKGADLRGVTGLTKEQLATCKAKGAIIDENSTIGSSQSTVSPPLSSQSNDIQTSSAPSVQGSTLPPDTDGSRP